MGSSHDEASFGYSNQEYTEKGEIYLIQEFQKYQTSLFLKELDNVKYEYERTIDEIPIDAEEVIDDMLSNLSIDEFHVLDEGTNVTEKKTTLFVTTCILLYPEIKVSGDLLITETSLVFYPHEIEVQKEFNLQHSLTTFSRKIVEKNWQLSDIEAVYSRRYLLRWTALEIFFLNGKSYFFHFPKSDDKRFYKELVRTTKISEHYYGHSKKLMEKRKSVTEQWVERKISNFDYLIALNTIAGRTYNDLNQYPIFPWILKNYTSDSIDLCDIDNYRDLTKPMGAQIEEKEQEVKEKYESLIYAEDLHPFHYGSHYSSIGTVLYYLLRVEPFSSQFICFQGGKFDYADRLFHSISTAYANCTQSSSDFKELVPEFFYFPGFLQNKNDFNLGTTQDGVEVGEVELPPWAKTPQQFIDINRYHIHLSHYREALESEYVSQNLHHWIDLIFGYKQSGDAGVIASNIFYHLTYEESLKDIDLSDAVGLKAITDQIENFGQTPPRLFSSSHPKRQTKISSLLYYIVRT